MESTRRFSRKFSHDVSSRPTNRKRSFRPRTFMEATYEIEESRKGSMIPHNPYLSSRIDLASVRCIQNHNAKESYMYIVRLLYVLRDDDKGRGHDVSSRPTNRKRSFRPRTFMEATYEIEESRKGSMIPHNPYLSSRIDLASGN
uniref:Uncharacterized protein n=1 Tax=Ascaris lumbricoides TaxID=6252 RepID=A0A0M3I9X9_ASCLU